MDKIVHSIDVKNVNLLNNVKTIFLFRSPRQTLPSIHKLNPEKYPTSVSFNYYIDRIKNIQKTADKLDPEKWIYTTYDELVNNQTKAFQKFEKFLKLSTNLSSSYDTIWSTGIRGIGDGSSHIHKGKIIQNKKPKELPESLKPYLEKAEEIYTDCLNTLTQIEHA